MTSRNVYDSATPATPAFTREALSPPHAGTPSTNPSAPTRTSSDSVGYVEVPIGVSSAEDLQNSSHAAIPDGAWLPAPGPAKRSWRRTHRSRLSAAFSTAIARAGLLVQRDWDPLDAPREFARRNAGLLLVATAQAFFALMNVSVKVLNSLDPPVPAIQLILVRMLVTWICCAAYMLITSVPHPFAGPPGVRVLLITRGVVGFFGLFGMYFSLQYLSLADATVLTFLTPFCTALAGAVLLGERMKRGDIFAGLFSMVGVLLIARPPFLFGGSTKYDDDRVTSDQRLRAVGVALVGVLGATAAFISLRAIGKRAHALHSLNSFAGQCVLVCSILLAAMRTTLVFPTQPVFLLLLLLIGLFGFAAQFLLVLGLQRETAGRGSIGMYAQLVFALALERAVFDTRPGALSVAGTGIIVGCALYVALTKQGECSQKERKIVDQEAEEGLLANAQAGEGGIPLIEQKIAESKPL